MTPIQNKVSEIVSKVNNRLYVGSRLDLNNEREFSQIIYVATSHRHYEENKMIEIRVDEKKVMSYRDDEATLDILRMMARDAFASYDFYIDHESTHLHNSALWSLLTIEIVFESEEEARNPGYGPLIGLGFGFIRSCLLLEHTGNKLVSDITFDDFVRKIADEYPFLIDYKRKHITDSIVNVIYNLFSGNFTIQFKLDTRRF